MSSIDNHDAAERPSPQPSDSGKPAHAAGGHAATLLASVLLIFAAPVAIWSVLGDLSTSPLPPAQSDYLVRPILIPQWIENTAGILALVLIVVCALVLYQNQKRSLVTPRQWIVLVLLLPAGLIIGFAARVLTANVIGANIGGAMMIMFALPVAGTLILAAVIYLFVSLARQHGRGDRD